MLVLKAFCTIILLFLFFYSKSVSGQEILHYSLSDGLSSIEISDIEENENFLWIGTSNGLNRFDGKHFKIFRYDKSKKNSISENSIETLFFDSSGLLWIGLTNGGINIYDPKKDFFYKASQIFGQDFPDRVISIYEDSQKNIWLGSWEQGLYQLIPKNGNFPDFDVVVHYPGYIVSSLIEYPKGYLRMGTYYGLFTCDISRNEWTDNENQNVAITQFLQGKNEQSLLCATWADGLLEVSWDTSEPAQIKIGELIPMNESGPIYRLLNGNQNNLYLGTWGNGLKLFKNNSSGTPGQIKTDEFDPSFINCIFKDSYQNIWIGTYGEGLYRLNTEKKGVYHFSGKNLHKPAVSLTTTINNQVFVGTQGNGVFLFDFLKDTLIGQFEELFTGSFNSYILSMVSDENNLFVGHDGHGMYIASSEKRNKNILKEYNFPSGFEKVTSILPEKDGKIWAGTKQNGLFSFKLIPGNKIPQEFTYYDSFGHEGITGIVPFYENTLFISSNQGLYLFSTTDQNKDLQKVEIGDESVITILPDYFNKCLWVSTSTNLKYIPFNSPDTLINPLPNDLLFSGTIRTMILDAENNLWFGLGERLYCYNFSQNRLKEINPDLISNQTLLSSSSVKANSREYLVFGTSDELLVIEPEFLLDQTDESKIILSRLEIDHKNINVGDKSYGKVILNEATEYISKLELSHKCKWISLSFVKSGREVFNTNFQFRIKGFSESWQIIDFDNPVTFSQLLPGDYTLEIRRHSGETISPVEWSLELTVNPPWWKTKFSGFIWVLSSILLLVFIVYILNQRIKRKHAQNLELIEKQKQDELIREKESFFSGLSHDLLTTFSLILAPVNDLIRENEQTASGKEKLDIIKKNTTFLSDIFGTIFDYKQAEFSDNRIKENIIEIVSFSNSVVNAFEYLAISKKIDLSFKSNIDKLCIRIDSIKVERILFNLLSNALKYTPESGKVVLSLEFNSGNILHFIVKDNGIGIEQNTRQLIFEKFYRGQSNHGKDETKGLGLGLYIVKKFVSLLNGNIKIESAINSGTTITISLPVVQISHEREPAEFEPEYSFSEEKSTILVVEDNKELLDYTTEKLRTYFNIISASSGDEALKSVETYLPEIIITDVMMPGLDGLELTRKIKEDPRLSDIFIVILSAKSTTDDELKGYKQGADIYLKKPIDMEVLFNQLVNIHKTRLKRKSQLYSEIISKDLGIIEFDKKESFLKWAFQVIEENLMDSGFSIENFASRMNTSKSVLHRKFRILVGQTPNQFIRLVRLRRSVELLKTSDLSISEIAYMTGFNHSHYYIKCFKEVYGKTPNNYRKGP